MLDRFPGLALAAALAAGIGLRGCLPRGTAALAVAGCGLAAALGAVVSLLERIAERRGLRAKRRGPRIETRRHLARCLLFLVAGFWRAPEPAPPPQFDPEDAASGDAGEKLVRMQGTIVEPPVEVVEDRDGVRSILTRFSVELEDGRGSLPVSASGRLHDIRGGSRVACLGMYFPSRGPRNPGDMEARGNGFLAVPHPACVGRLPPHPWPTRAVLLGAVRERLLRALESLYPERMLGFVAAMLLGDRRLLAPDIRDALLYTGTFHLLAISGLHVVLVMFFVLRVPLPARVRTPARLLFLAGFTLLTGASPPVVRAALMFALDLLARRFHRSPKPLNTLGWSAVLLLGLDPMLLGNAGFQLSFVSVAAILTWGARLSRNAGNLPFIARLFSSSVAISVGTSAVTAPLILLHFQRLHPLGPLWNLLAYPLTLVPLAGGALSLGLGLIHPALGLPVAYAVDRTSEALLWPLAIGATFPGSTIALPPPPAAAVCASYALLLGGLVSRWRKACFVLGGGALLAACCAPLVVPRVPELWVFDAGPGDAALLNVPGAGSILIDAGARGNDDAARRNLPRTALSVGSKPIAAAFFSHAHADHLRGFAGVAERLAVGGIYIPPAFERFEAGRSAVAAAQGARIPVHEVSRGFRARFPSAAGTTRGLVIDVLYPQASEDLPLAASENDTSLALRITFAGSRILFLGDLEEDGLARIFAMEDDLRADILLAPHHGRANKLWPVLLERVRPREVIFSGTGDQSARALAERLEAEGIRVHATSRGGAVRARWNRERGWEAGYWREK